MPLQHITFSSDGQGGLPDFDERGKYTGLQVGKVTSLYEAVREAIIDENIPIEIAIQVITSNPAKILKLFTKGYIQVNHDADLVFLEKETLKIDTVIALGQIMIEKGKVKVKGTFE